MAGDEARTGPAAILPPRWSAERDGPHVSHRRAVGALTALSVAAFCYVTTEVLPTGLLTVISGDLNQSPSRTGLLVTGYALVVLVFSVPLTRLTRRVPRRLLLTAALVLFTVGALWSSVAGNFTVLLVARLLTGLTHALFWSVVASTATGMFPPHIRGRMMARLAIGNSLAPVLGVPLGTWLGQQTNWRVSFAALSALSLITCVAVAVLLPTVPPEKGGAARGRTPDRLRFATLLIATGVGVTGALGTYTYITPFLIEFSGFPEPSLGLLLSVSGVAGVVGNLVVGRFLDAHPWGALVGSLTLACGAMLGLFAAGATRAAAVALLALLGMSFSAFAAAVAHRALLVAPGSTDMASAATSSVFNLGTAAGSLAGAALLTVGGVRHVPLLGGLLCGLALIVMVTESWLAARSSRDGECDASSGSL